MSKDNREPNHIDNQSHIEDTGIPETMTLPCRPTTLLGKEISMNRVTCERDGVPLSAVDLAMVADGATSKAALSETTTLAHCADQLGFARFWVAEHHNMSTVASTCLLYTSDAADE